MLRSGWSLTIASFCALVQSLIFIALSVAAALVYLCVIPVDPYSKPEDFYRVTLVKLYFEGPKCIPDGKYLGKFNEDYKNPDKIKLMTPDLIFATMVAYAILHALYFVVSLLFFCNRTATSKEGRNRLRDTVLGWSILTLVISLFDIFLTVEMVFDVFSLLDYISSEKDAVGKHEKFSEIFLIPVALALISSRIIVFWFWNIFVGLIFFFKALSCETLKEEPLTLTARQEVIEELKEVTEEIPTQRPNYRTGPDFRNHPEWNRFRYSMETVTPFNEPHEVRDPRWNFPPSSEHSWAPTRYTRYERQKEQAQHFNEGFVNDEQEPPETTKPEATTKGKPEDFDHDLKNFEPGKRKIKIVKGPVGKPVSIPIPPPLPAFESYTC